MIDLTFYPDELDVALDDLADDLCRPELGVARNLDSEQYQLPITYFGSKRRVVIPTWLRLGCNVPNYLEVFAGSGAIFFGRTPNFANMPRREVLSDEYSALVNVYRTLQYGEPGEIARICKAPYFETDIVAWNHDLIRNRFILRSNLQADPKFFEPELGARWIWQNRGWIGGGACDPRTNVRRKMIKARIASWKLGSPELLFEYLQHRLKDTQIFNHSYARAISSATQTTSFKITAIFMDPPYPKNFCSRTYAYQQDTVAYEAFERALVLGRDPKFRIAYCGYGRIFGAIFAKEGWEQMPCINSIGYSNQAANGRGRDNRKDEYIWFSPHCLKVK